jgi:hypothetical protein
MIKTFFLLSLAAMVTSDLRAASRPRSGYKLRQYGGRGNQNCVAETSTDTTTGLPAVNKPLRVPYMEPDVFGYEGLVKQKRKNYDNFLRSNIDNEQDNRNFRLEEGRDHLPYRTEEGGVTTMYNETNREEVRTVYVAYPGVERIICLRWNNPHASEIEVNIWLRNTQQNMVVPIKLPSCSAEGHQNGVVSFIVPTDFMALKSSGTVKNIDGSAWEGCTTENDCVLQIYAHSVESRTYVIAAPIIIEDKPEGVANTNVAAGQTTTDDLGNNGDGLTTSDLKIVASTTRIGTGAGTLELTGTTQTFAGSKVFIYLGPTAAARRLIDKVIFTGIGDSQTENSPPFEYFKNGLDVANLDDLTITATLIDYAGAKA